MIGCKIHAALEKAKNERRNERKRREKKGASEKERKNKVGQDL